MANRPARQMRSPMHAILLAFPVALFAAAVLTDLAYLNTAEIQWSNFSAWLIAAGLLGGGLTLLWAIVSVVRAGRTVRHDRPAAYLLLLAAMWIAGFVNALLDSRDAWHAVTWIGAVLSMIAALLAMAAAWIFHSGPPRIEQS